MSRGYNITRIPFSLTIANGQTAKTSDAVNLNGYLRGVLVNAPALDGTVTVTVDVLDADGFTMFTKASVAEGAKTALLADANNVLLGVPLSGAHTVRVTASGAQSGGDDTIVVTLLIDKG